MMELVSKNNVLLPTLSSRLMSQSLLVNSSLFLKTCQNALYYPLRTISPPQSKNTK